MTSLQGEEVSGGFGYRFPLSYAQQRLWFLDRLERGSPAYNIPVVLRLRGDLDVAALEGALAGLVQRHEALRTAFPEEDGEPFQVVHPPNHPDLEIIDLQDHADGEARIADAVRETVNRPFSLAEGPVIRCTLLRLGPHDHVLAIVVHHIVADAWSLGVLRRDLSELYRANLENCEPKLPELDVQYGDFAVWQRDWFAGERLDTQLAYWKQALAGAPGLLELPTDRPRPALQSDNGGHARAIFPRELAERLEELGRKENATLFMVLLAGFATLLSRYADQEDIVVGTPIANRQRLELEPLIGFFANTLALRLDLEGRPTFRQALATVRNVVLDAFAHQDLPFEQLVAELNPTRTLSHSPLFQVLFQVHVAAAGEGDGYRLAGLQAERINLDRGKAKFDLALTMRSDNEGLHASFEYSADLFDAETVTRMLGHLRTLLEEAAANPDQPLVTLPIVTKAEQEQLAIWNRTAVTRAEANRCVHELFETQAAHTPDAHALAFGGSVLTYDELNARANRLAWRLRELGVGPDTPVAISMNRSFDLVASVLAALKAGGAYVPLDPTYPAERLEFMLREAEPPVVLTTTDLAAQLPRTDAHVICLDDEGGDVTDESCENPPPLADADNLGYVLFTSGSTGWPKGVAMPQRPLTNLLLWQREHFTARRAARTLQFASLNFDVAFQEIFSTLVSGGTLVLVDDDTRRDTEALLRLLDDEQVERLFLPFAALQHVAETADDLGLRAGALREVITAGEALQASPAIRRFFAAHAGCVLHNQYGPTESHVATAFTLDLDSGRWPETPPIGTPIANSRIWLLDANDQVVPVGVPGQLHIGGPILARGYLNRPDLTSERFVADPFGNEGERLYRTGDTARLRSDGNLEFLGRRDDQVKVRGYRVELGEIEAVLLRHEELREAAAVVRDDDAGERRLVAYVVPDRQPGPSAAALREFLARSLPEYFVPTAFVTLDALPLGATGKIDRRALPAPDRRQTVDEQLMPPRNETERRLVRIWQAVLGIAEPLGVKDDFFALGGHSLLAVRLVAKVERELSVKLPLATLFEGATVERMAERIVELRGEGKRLPTLTPLKSSGTKTPLFLLHGSDGELMIYRELVSAISSDQPVYGIQPIGLDGRDLPFLNLQEMAAHYVSELRAFAPEGPYLLAGYCFSGVLAYEVAHQLSEQGHAPDLLALIDASPRGHRQQQRPTRGEIERQKLQDFLARDLRGKLSWITRRFAGVGYKLRSRVRFALYNYARRGPRWLPRSLLNVEGAIFSALETYRTPTSALHVTLLRAVDTATQTFSTRSNWRAVTDEVEIRPIFAEGIQHDNIVREPYVSLLAAELEACIARALALREREGDSVQATGFAS